MEQSKISEALQLQLEEAVVAVFMEQYAQYTDGDQTVEDTMDFPAELEERCRKVINRARAKRSSKKILQVLNLPQVFFREALFRPEEM